MRGRRPRDEAETITEAVWLYLTARHVRAAAGMLRRQDGGAAVAAWREGNAEIRGAGLRAALRSRHPGRLDHPGGHRAISTAVGARSVPQRGDRSERSAGLRKRGGIPPSPRAAAAAGKRQAGTRELRARAGGLKVDASDAWHPASMAGVSPLADPQRSRQRLLFVATKLPLTAWTNDGRLCNSPARMRSLRKNAETPILCIT